MLLTEIDHTRPHPYGSVGKKRLDCSSNIPYTSRRVVPVSKIDLGSRSSPGQALFEIFKCA
jgi:hypothetical protein